VKNQSLEFCQLRRHASLDFLLWVSVVAAEALTGLSALLSTPVAVAVLLLAEWLSAVAETLRELGSCVLSREGVWVLSDDLVDGLRSLHVIIIVSAGLAETGLNGVNCTWSHIFPMEKQAQYILRHWLLVQLHPVYLFSFDDETSSSRMRWLEAVEKRALSLSLQGSFCERSSLGLGLRTGEVGSALF
jgi:hypothetical protein